MNDKEKRELATKMLERNGYTKKEIEKILWHAFGDEKVSNKKKQTQ